MFRIFCVYFGSKFPSVIWSGFGDFCYFMMNNSHHRMTFMRVETTKIQKY